MAKDGGGKNLTKREQALRKSAIAKKSGGKNITAAEKKAFNKGK